MRHTTVANQRKPSQYGTLDAQSQDDTQHKSRFPNAKALVALGAIALATTGYVSTVRTPSPSIDVVAIADTTHLVEEEASVALHIVESSYEDDENEDVSIAPRNCVKKKPQAVCELHPRRRHASLSRNLWIWRRVHGSIGTQFQKAASRQTRGDPASLLRSRDRVGLLDRPRPDEFVRLFPRILFL